MFKILMTDGSSLIPRRQYLYALADSGICHHVFIISFFFRFYRSPCNTGADVKEQVTRNKVVNVTLKSNLKINSWEK